MKTISFIVLLVTLVSFGLPSSYGICDQGNLTVGVLLPLSGDYASTGLSAQTALGLAEADINKFLSDTGRSTRINFVIRDTKTDPETTLEALKDLQAHGLRIFIGPEDSASLSRVREYANESGIILISGASTAPSLAIANDTTFRMASDDTHMADAMVALMLKDGVKTVIPLARSDLWGDDLINATKKSLSSEGGMMLNPIRYGSNTKDFTQTFGDLKAELKDARDKYGNNSVAVDMMSFDEATIILSQASEDSALSSVRWFGSDPSGVTIQQNDKANQFASKVGFVYPTFGQENSTVYRRISEEVKQRYGINMISYAVNDYDAAWLVTYTYLVAGSGDPVILKKTLPIFARTYRGYSGDGALNDAGDRAFAIYTFWAVKALNGTIQDVPITKYVFNPSEGAYWSPV